MPSRWHHAVLTPPLPGEKNGEETVRGDREVDEKGKEVRRSGIRDER